MILSTRHLEDRRVARQVCTQDTVVQDILESLNCPPSTTLGPAR
jgi:hypothetical protein